jgi:hypothetical protein
MTFKQTLDQQVIEKRGIVTDKKSQKKQFDNMVIRQVEDFKKDEHQQKLEDKQKVFQQKNVRDQQYYELIKQKQDAKIVNKEYEQKLVDDNKEQLRKEKEKKIKKKIDFMEEFHKASKINDDNNMIKVDLKEQERLRDVILQVEAIARVDRIERQRKEEYEVREARIATHMKASEQGAVAEDNKKMLYLQQMIITNEVKKKQKDYLDDELKRKK